MRRINSIKNMSTGLICQIIGMILNFISRTIFISILGANYLGLNGLFTNIISILSLADMGIGSAIIYSLYKPLAINDEYKIIALMRFYKGTYIKLGILIFILGSLVIPYLDLLVDKNIGVNNINLIYILFLLNTVASYLLSYKKAILVADQKSYITTIYTYTFNFIFTVIQVIILIYSKNYLLYLIANIVKTILENISISFKIDKMYPLLKTNIDAKLDDLSKREIIKNVKAMICHKLGGVVVSGTDNLIISTFLNLNLVGIYSNYTLIINSVNLLLSQIFVAFTASLGNLNVLENKNKLYNLFKNILFINFWIAGFCSIALLCILNTFIELWLGSSYVFNEWLVLIIVINFYMAVTRYTVKVYKDSLGLFWNDRYKPIFEAIINMVVSILLVNKIGIAGVFIGTLISTITTTLWVGPYVLYKFSFNIKLREYFYKWVMYTFLNIISGYITYKACLIITEPTWTTIIFKLIIVIIIPNSIFLISFFKTDEFKYFKDFIKLNIRKLVKN